MAPRDTRTGGVLERMVLPALEQGHYSYETQVHVGLRLGGGRHLVDVVAGDPSGRSYLISLKWQQTSGTAEQKVPFEVICLAEAIMSSGEKYSAAYVVLGGGGWKLRSFYIGGGLNKHLTFADRVRVLTLEEFVGRANKGQL
jgi:hypothetical protein